MKKWDVLVSKESIDQAIENLKVNGIDVMFVETGEQARKQVLSLIPIGSEVMTMSSVTLETVGLTQEINESGKYASAKNKLNSMNRDTQALEMQRLGAAPEYTVGSVHAVTEDGQVIIASNTGSQLPAYAYASSHVIWVVGAQKIVKNLEEGMARINEYVLVKESARVKIAYGMEKSNVSKLLIISKEITPGRLTVIFVNEVLGF